MAAGWQNDPVVGGAPAAGGGGWQNDPVVGGAKTVQSSSGVSSPIASTALSFADAFAGGLGRTNPFMEMPQGFKQDISQAHQNLGLMDYPVSIAAYMMGPGKVLGPEGMTAGLAGRPIAQAAAEGALAGGYSNFDPNNPYGTAAGAAGGAVLGGAAGGVGKRIAKLTAGKAPPIDSAQVTAQTKQARTAAYDALNQVQMNPTSVDQAIGGVMNNLDPSVQTGMSPGLNRQINDIREAVQQQPAVTAGQVDSWQRQINAAAQRERYPTDNIVAGQIDSQLDGLFKQSGAGDLQDAAQAAHQNYAMAQNLEEWQRKAAAGADLGQAPLTEAERYYQGKPEYQSLVDLYKKNQSQFDPSWALGHLAAGAIGDIGGAMFGFPGHFGGELLGYLGVKPAIKTAFKGVKQNAVTKNIQQLYPQMTGVTPPPTQATDPRLGDLIKSLTLGAAY